MLLEMISVFLRMSNTFLSLITFDLILTDGERLRPCFILFLCVHQILQALFISINIPFPKDIHNTLVKNQSTVGDWVYL